MIERNRLIPIALVLSLACGGAEREADPATPPPNDAQRAAAVAKALRAAPSKSDSVLTANGLTAASLEQLMMRVAADSALSAEYARLTTP